MDGHPGRSPGGDLADRVAALEAALAERLEVVQSLRDSEERLRTLLENSPDSITVLDADAKILYLNRTIPSRRVEDIIGTVATSYLQKDQAEQFLRKLRLAMETGEPQLIEVETVSHHQWWETRLVPLRRDGRVTAVMGIGADVTERRRAEEALRRSEEMLRLAVQSARMGLWTWDVDTDTISFDAACATMAGFPGPGDASLAELVRRVVPEEQSVATNAAERLMESGELSDFEFKVSHPDGSVRSVVLSGRRAEGKSLMIGGAFDVTERRRLEEQLRQAQKMEAVGQLTAGIAHNFNNLLTAIIPSVQLARRDLPGPAGERLQDAEYAAGRAAELVKQLMVFARHRRRATKESVDVRALVRRTVGICRATFDRSIELRVSEAADLPLVLGEAGQIEQVLLNIYLNARDALESASERTIRTEIDWTTEPGAGATAVCIRISDTGAGMAEAVRARVFEPFFTTKEVGRGSGLGLATAYAIATDHGGQLSCESTLGEGTVFSLTLPAAREPAPAVGAARGSALGGSETILVVDDERLVRKAVRGILEPAGYRVLEAPDGEEGFEVFQKERGRVALVLLDLSMPGIPSNAVLASILRERPKTRVVLFTGQRPDSIPVGVTAVLQKPVQIEELLRVVRDACDTDQTGLT